MGGPCGVRAGVGERAGGGVGRGLGEGEREGTDEAMFLGVQCQMHADPDEVY